jgi:hypothetical protein
MPAKTTFQRTSTRSGSARNGADTDHYEVSEYALFLATHMTKGERAHFYAYIVCQGKQGQTLTFYFVRPDAPIPPNSYDPGTRKASAYLPHDQYLWYVDALRNERPVYAYVSRANPEWNRIHTGKEPVGEGER